ncbi:MAG: PAS domain S-box protein [Anaerolineae bacterium]|nr:PAS domain S-box protein [Anaerolineae bacterium]
MDDDQKTREQLLEELAALRSRLAAADQSDLSIRGLFKNALDAMLLLDNNAHLTDVNQAACDLLGFTREELLQMTVSDITPAPHREASKQLWNEFLVTGSLSGEYLLLQKDGSTVEVDFRAVTNIAPGLHLSIMRDISPHKQAIEELKASEERYRTLVESITAGVYVLDHDLRYLLANEVTAALSRYPADELIGRKITDVFPGVADTAFLKTCQDVLESGNADEVVEQIVFPDDSPRWYEVFVYPVPEGILCIANDITERRQAAEALRRERDLLERLMETSPVAITVLDREGQITYTNRQAELMLGLSRNEITRRTYNAPNWRITDFDGKPIADDQLPFSLVKASGESVYNIRHAIEKTDGGCIYLSINASPLFDHENRFDGMITAMEDITDRIKTIQALAESEERYRALVDTSPNAIMVIQDGRYVFVNPALASMLGYDSLDKVIGLSPLDVTAPEYQSVVRDRVKNVELGQTNPPIEIVLVRPDQSTLFFEATSVPISFHEKPAVLVIGQDTTQRRQIEAALRESEEKFSKAFYGHPIAMQILDVTDGTRLDMNDSFYQLTGYSKEELVGSNIHDLNIWNNPDEVMASLDRLSIDGYTKHFPAEIVTKSGEIRNVLISSAVLDLGEKQLAIGSFIDVTEQRQAEADLRKTQFAIDNSSTALFIFNTDSQLIYVNKKACQSLQYTEEELLSMTVPDIDRDRKIEEMPGRITRMKQQGSMTFETWHVRKDGTSFPVLITSTYLNFEGKDHIFSFVTDITELKQAEADLRKTQFAVDNSSTAVVIFRADGLITYVNETACQNLQYTREELLSMTIPDLDLVMMPDKWTHRAEELKRGRSLTFERWHVRKDGTSFPVLITTTYLDFQGEELFFSFVLDITERKEAEKQLREYSEHLEEMVEARTVELSQINEQLSTILDNTPDAVLLLNKQGIIESVNPAFCNFFKCSTDGPIGQPLTRLIDPDYHHLIAKYLDTIEEHPGAARLEVLANRKDGTTFDADIALALVREDETLLGIVCTVRDISDLKAVERMKTEFLATAAHELRTPLTSIRGFSEILLERDLSQEREDYYHRIIKEQSTHLAQIIDDLLDISRLEAGYGLGLRNEMISLDAIISSVVNPFIDTSPQHTFTHIENSNVPTITGDPFRLNQVFQNLLSNAVKFSPKGGEVSITCEVIGESIRVSIRDQGIGLSKEQQENIFERFYRVDSSNTSIGGTGLGLTISKLIVELHGGDMWVESDPGKGSTFFFTLPIQSTKD